jgi:putative heme-binding domain-containing protein
MDNPEQKHQVRGLSVAALLLLVATAAAADNDQRRFGIDKRVPWTTSRITGSPEPPLPYRVERVFPKLHFENPVTLTNAPGTDRLFVVELNGKIYSFRNDNTVEQPDLFFDVKTANEKVDKVYGFTFHPKFAENRICYVCYTAGQNLEDGTRVSRFKVSKTDPPRVDSQSEETLITWSSGGHNGGCLKFGHDGYLYISSGDGGPAFPPDPKMSGQDVSTLLSCVLRIDVDRPDGERLYSIPSDNPFVDLKNARGEIWAYGFRNPWRMSFDSETGDLWVGDVGWELWELIYRVERGANYGWSLVEGPQPVHRERPRGPTPVVEPTVAHSHIESRSITGGMVYRGKRLKDLVGAYVYGDYVTGKMWAARHDGEKLVSLQEITDTSLAIICYGVDNANELYVVAYDGSIHRLVENTDAAANEEFPTKLSETGLFASVKDHAVAPGVVPYSIVAEPWIDGAVAERYVALPGETNLGIHDATNVQVGYIKGTWKFPTDGVLMKTISLEMERGNAKSRRRLETQILHFDVDTWRGYSYLWNDEQTDAVLAPNQATEQSFEIIDPDSRGGRRQQTWRFSSRTECILCHTTRGGSIYGFVPSQLDKDHDYGGVVDNQLRVFKHVGLFEETSKDPSKRMTNPYDESADLEQRARSYLHVNCAHCHRRGGGGTAAMDIQHHLSLEKTNLRQARPTQGTFGIHGAEVLGAGDPYRSVMLYRMSKLGKGRMPYVGSSVVDQAGVRLIHDWIASLDRGDEAPADSARPIQAAALAKLSEGQSPEQHQAAVNELLSKTSGALMLLSAIDANKLTKERRTQAVELAFKHDGVLVRGLFERFLPEEQRTKRLGSTINPQDILRLDGSVERGRALFLTTAGVQCKNCHQVGKEGKAVGPELSQIGKKYNRGQLLESVLFPSKLIDPKYVTQLVETVDGRVVTGVLVETNEEVMILKDPQAKEVRIPRDEIEFAAPQQKSLMPELLLQDMTAQQVADLIEFLASQR